MGVAGGLRTSATGGEVRRQKEKQRVSWDVQIEIDKAVGEKATTSD